MTLLSWLPAAMLHDLGWTLLHFLWQGLLLAALLEVALAMTRSAVARHNLALAALLLMAAAPVATFLFLHVPQDMPPHHTGGAIMLSASGNSVSGPVAGVVPAGQAPASAASAARPSLSLSGPWMSWLVLCWFAGMASLSLRALAGWWMVTSLRRREVTGLPPDLLARCHALQQSLGVTRAVRFLQSARVSVPVVIGWVRPVILVPAAALAGLSPPQLEALIRHELAHIRRHDALINLVQLVTETILFYHPAVWHVSRRIRIERENCCDDLAVSGCGDAVLYVEALTALEAGRLPPGLVLAAHGGHLRDRVARLLGIPARPRRHGLPALAGLLVTGLVAGTVALAQPGTQLKQSVPVAAKAVEKAIELVLATPPRVDLTERPTRVDLAEKTIPAAGPAIGEGNATLAQAETVVRAGNTQVMLKLRIAEVSRSAARQLGVSSVNGAAIISAAGNAQEMFKALEQAGLVHLLAEPNLTAVSGETAKFRVGGEFPIPTGRDHDGNITLEFKPFGVGFTFTPMVMSAERISIQLSTEVSEIFNSGNMLAGVTTHVNGVPVTKPGISIPALGVRRTETSIEVPSGGSFAMGLLQQNVKKEMAGIPGARDMPVLGALFRSRDFQNDETELVVLVSAELVQPDAAPVKQGALARPAQMAQSNMAETARRFAHAAALGNRDAQFNLAALYERGDGVPQSLTNAYIWYSIAGAAGDNAARQRAAFLSGQIPEAERTAAQRSAAAFRVRPPAIGNVQQGAQPLLQEGALATPVKLAQAAAPAVSVSPNETPYSAALRCMSDVTAKRPLRIAVGQISDHTGTNQMAADALAKAGLPMTEPVGSDFYLVVGDVEVFVAIPPSGDGRPYVMDIDMNLRLVNSATKEVVDMVRLQKQIIGRQISPGTFSFLGANFDTAADKKVDPVEHVIRSGIERGLLQMIGKAYAAQTYGVQTGACAAPVDYLRG